VNNEIFYVYLDDILPNRFQPRKHFDEKELNDLAESIRQQGVIQPLIVRRLGEKYEIIAGERRYKASTIAGLEKVPVIVKEMDDKEAAEVALIENVQRQDLTAIEEAESYNKLINLSSLTQEQVANKVGVTQSTIANKLRLLALTPEVKEALLNKKISERHARSLLRISEPIKQNEMLEKIINEKLPVRIVDELINGGPRMNQESNENLIPNIPQNQNPAANQQIVQETAPVLPTIEPIEIPTLSEAVQAPIPVLPEPVLQEEDSSEGESGSAFMPVQETAPVPPVMEAPAPMPTIEVSTMPRVENQDNIFASIPEISTPAPEQVAAPTPVVPQYEETPMPAPEPVAMPIPAVEQMSSQPQEQPGIEEQNKNKYVNTPEQQPVEIKTNIESIINEFKQKAAATVASTPTPEQVAAPTPVVPQYEESPMPAPEPVAMPIPAVEQAAPQAPVEVMAQPTPKDVMEAVESIKQKISENIEKGYKIVVEDFDFKRSYQMIVKIEKE